MPGVFISYRRKASQVEAQLLRERLVARFDDEQVRVFFDVDRASIPLGQDFVQVIDRAMALSSIVIAVIGPDSLTGRDEEGRRRVDLPDDWYRTELETALDRNKPILPVFVR